MTEYGEVKERNWYPLSYISFFQAQITELLEDSKKQLALFLSIKGNPAAIDDELHDRAIRLFKERPQYIQLYQEQVDRWQEEDIDNSHKRTLEIMNNDLKEARKLNQDILDLLNELETIEDLVAKDDFEVALDFLSGKLRLPGRRNCNTETALSIDKYISNQSYNITDRHISYCNEYRMLMQLFTALFVGMLEESKNIIEQSLRRLNLGDEFLIDVLMFPITAALFDSYCIYGARYNGLTIAEKVFGRNSHYYQGRALEIFAGVSRAKFAFLEVVSPIGEDGAIVYDHVLEKEQLLLDKEATVVACRNGHYFLLGYFVELEDFLVTVGVFIAVDVTLKSGYCLYSIMMDYKDLCSHGEVSLQERAQYTTDMYKICMHENLEKYEDAVDI